MAIEDSFFYDAQLRRYILQFVRLFSNFHIQTGSNASNSYALLRVPVKYGDISRQGASILNNNSENTRPAVPQISLYISDLRYSTSRIQEPNHIDKIQVRQRQYDSVTGQYTPAQATALTVERHMPAPYDLEITVDIWTSNTTQKLQLLEQILPLFNPSLDVQSTDNYLDWTSLTTVYLESTSWTSRSIPMGTEEQIDIATLRFSCPVWISMPARVKKQGVIHKIIASMFNERGEIAESISDDALLLGTRQYITPMNYGVMLVSNELRLLEPFEKVSSDDNDTPSKTGSDLRWTSLVDQYGSLNPGISQVRLEQENGSFIVGTIEYVAGDPYVLRFNTDTDTVPSNTLAPVDKIVDPKRTGPGAGLPAAAAGQRYLILDNIGSDENTDGADAWKGSDGSDFVAKENDIIEYTGQNWTVMFRGDASNPFNFVTNIKTGIQYKWTGEQWIKSYEGEYSNGHWGFVL